MMTGQLKQAVQLHMKKHHLSKAQFAVKSKLSVQTVNRLLSGKQVNAATILKLRSFMEEEIMQSMDK